ncbi:hypothetical protein [Moorena producens]|uniref:hypothetical protein n=1 Tax=Moorena producens TaxID=1155739 RepID=UPI0013144D4B|nr:hypothetical protein [Moorena producens]
MQSLMGETTAVAHGGTPKTALPSQDRAPSLVKSLELLKTSSNSGPFCLLPSAFCLLP